ncbi:MAG: hypothetical protein JSR58_02125 [Verrucomicrobia bacterium]|nr:hypothetical protein [Verrucomicrobiota bacterium]
MEELYVESFFGKKASSAVTTELGDMVPAQPEAIPLTKSEQQIHSFFWLLKQELNKHYQEVYPIQKLLRQIEEGLNTKGKTDVVPFLDELEEFLDLTDV